MYVCMPAPAHTIEPVFKHHHTPTAKMPLQLHMPMVSESLLQQVAHAISKLQKKLAFNANWDATLHMQAKVMNEC